jgi:hypothetical protein
MRLAVVLALGGIGNFSWHGVDAFQAVTLPKTFSPISHSFTIRSMSTTGTTIAPSGGGENNTNNNNNPNSDDPKREWKIRRRAQLLQARTKRVNTIAYTNALIVGSLGLAAVYHLFHVDVEALLALWEYDLGMHIPGTISKSAVAADLLARLPADAIQSYESLVASVSKRLE